LFGHSNNVTTVNQRRSNIVRTSCAERDNIENILTINPLSAIVQLTKHPGVVHVEDGI